MGPLEDFSRLVGPLLLKSAFRLGVDLSMHPIRLGHELQMGPLEDFSRLVGPLLLKSTFRPRVDFSDASGTAWTRA